jgi:hypothetical protein
LFAESLVSSTWAFRFDPPEGYALEDGNGKDRFSFAYRETLFLDLVVYQPNRYASVELLAQDAAKRLKARSESSSFRYGEASAVLTSLEFDAPAGPSAGWALCIELQGDNPSSVGGGRQKPLLLALAYGPSNRPELETFHLSALDSISPTEKDRLRPGPVTYFTYPPEGKIPASLYGLPAQAWLDRSDAEAAQALITREYSVLKSYLNSALWKEAWARFYRAIHRDSYERLADLAFAVERSLQAEMDRETPGGAQKGNAVDRDWKFAEKTLAWVQGFAYERDLLGTDFVDLITAATEGRGDCDSRAMLWAIILQRANIPAAIMVSRDYSHAMGLADLEGKGARFTLADTAWIVAETTAKVPLGRIDAQAADPAKWLGILLP